MNPYLTRQDIIDGLGELSGELRRVGLPLHLRVMGGAALALHGQRVSVTRDIDVSTPLTPEVENIVAQIAYRRGWRLDWINDAVKMWVTHYDSPEDWEVYDDSDGVTISIASTKLLLAMKLYACRGLRDIEDIRQLFETCEVASRHDALSIFEKYYPNETLNQRAQDLISSHFAVDH